VAVGMVAEANIARRLGMCDEHTVARIAALCVAAGLPVSGKGFSAKAIIDAFARDKKSVGGTARFVLPRAIGEMEIGVEVSVDALREGLAATGFAE